MLKMPSSVQACSSSPMRRRSRSVLRVVLLVPRAREERPGLRVDVCRRVEREDAFQRQVVVHRREDGLLHLAGVSRAGDGDDALRKVKRDDGVAVHAVVGAVEFEAGRMEDRDVDIAVPERLRGDEHGPREDAVVRLLRDDADVAAVAGILRDDAVLDVELSA
jgi:hypothetical protein